MIDAVIVDDEKHAVESLRLMLEKYAPSVNIVNTYNDPREAISPLKNHPPMLLFLDIEMPFLSGFDLLREVGKLDFEIIFTTAYDDFAIRAFKVSAIDYLLKPIEREELVRAVEKFQNRLPQTDFQTRLQGFFEKYQGNTGPHRIKQISLPTKDGFSFVSQSDILRCESDSNYTTVYLVDGKKVVVSRTLKEIEGQLDESVFLRVHHSHVINLNYIKSYQKGNGGIIVMNNGDNVSVSRSRKQDFLDRI